MVVFYELAQKRVIFLWRWCVFFSFRKRSRNDNRSVFCADAVFWIVNSHFWHLRARLLRVVGLRGAVLLNFLNFPKKGEFCVTLCGAVLIFLNFPPWHFGSQEATFVMLFLVDFGIVFSKNRQQTIDCVALVCCFCGSCSLLTRQPIGVCVMLFRFCGFVN